MFGINTDKLLKLGIMVGIVIFLITLQSGCIGVQKSNLTVFIPESSLNTTIGKQESLQVAIIPLDADAKDAVINVSAPPGISLTDEHLYFMKYSNEFKTLAEDQEIIIPFNFSAISDGTFNLTVEIKASNANSTVYNYTVNAYIPAPSLEIGEYWIYNQTKGSTKGLQVAEVVGKDIIEGNEYYLIKETWEGDLNGTYVLSYYTTDSFSEKMTEYYEDGALLKEKTSEVDPPSSDFPFQVGTKGRWSGSITGLGKTEVNGEVVRKENLTVPAGTYTTYFMRKKISFSMATGVGEQWYVPELNGFAKYRITTNALGITTEDEIELVEHGKPPTRPRQIQIDIKIPDGYTFYKNDELNFRLAYPKNWKFSSKEDGYGSYFMFDDSSIYGVQITVESIGKLNLTEYRDLRMDFLKKTLPGVQISDQRSVTINGREGYQWVYEYKPAAGKGKMLVFVQDNKGYLIADFAINTVHDSYIPMFDNMVNSFFIKGSPNKFILS